MNALVTIITHDYLPYALSLCSTLSKYKSVDDRFVIFVSDGELTEKDVMFDLILFFQDVRIEPFAEGIRDKYSGKNEDAYRWSMKSVLIHHLLTKRGFNKVLFLDCDLFFFSDYQFLLSELDDADVLLSPHWRSSDPYKDARNFALQYNTGLFNGGFIGVSKGGADAMKWWAMACEYSCEIAPERGFYVDQTHLNSLPVFFPNVKILGHRGCNVANWNRVECDRKLQPDGSVLINGRWPLVFVHFTGSTIRGIIRGDDPVLMSCLQQFASALGLYGWMKDVIKIAEQQIARQRRTSLKSIIKAKLVQWIKVKTIL